MPINSSPGVAEQDHGPDYLQDDFGDWLGDYFNDAFWAPGGRQDVGGADWFGVSLGLANLSLLGSQGAFIPPVVQTPSFNPSITIPPPPPIRNGSMSWQDYMAAGGVLPADWGSYPMASDHPDVNSGATIVASSPPPGGNDVSILGDIYDWVDDNLAGGYLPGGVPSPGQSAPYYPGPQFALPATPVQVGGNGAVTTIPGTGGPVAAACGPVMIYNSKTGKWTKKRHRRRRQLATRSDIRDLSALKGVLGQGKLLEVWIATHS